MKYSQQEVAEALAKLRELLKPGDTVSTILRHKSRSGMSRSISLVLMDGGPQELDYWVSRVLGNSIDQRHGGIRIGGCGMDMGFALVYDLSRRLFPDGFGVRSEGGIRPRSKEHAAQLVAEGKTAFRGRNGDASGWDDDGGYALRHRWL